ncbi:hypothetical protein [Flavihumibacter fluvii]|uniref:hypothetical protein n=1 Tax=Flavihumibacter fluvii TaxID=2838157 RepID=UPI001BDE4E2B|nr:hypothetical protein [Flavihumibacter fluvii]ULQ51239.1 hypothetical protein KJS93_14205 [Flavihumibacter fluvii]
MQGNKMMQLSGKSPTISPEIIAARSYYRINTIFVLNAELYRYHQISIAVPKNPESLPSLLKLSPQYLFLPEKLQNIEPILSLVNAGTILVIDGSVPNWKARKWSQILKERQVKYYSTWESGALQIPINKF